MKLLLGRGASSEIHGADGVRPLLTASRNGHLPNVLALLRRGARVNAGAGPFSPLSLASQRGHTAVVQALLAHGADLNGPKALDKSGAGLPALHQACDGGHTDVAALLLSHGAAITVVRGVHPATRALEAGFHDVAAIVVQEMEYRSRWSPIRMAWVGAVVTARGGPGSPGPSCV